MCPHVSVCDSRWINSACSPPALLRTKTHRKRSHSKSIQVSENTTLLNSINTTTLISERISLFSQAKFFIPPKDTDALWPHAEHKVLCLACTPQLMPEDKDPSSWPTLGETLGTSVTPFKSPFSLVSKEPGSSRALQASLLPGLAFWT